VSVLAYDGERPGELRGNRWSDILTKTILVERAANPDGTLKSTKTWHRRATRLLAPLIEDLLEFYLELGSPPLDSLILPGDGDLAWTKTDWQVWRARTWGKAFKLAGMPSTPMPIRSTRWRRSVRRAPRWSTGAGPAPTRRKVILVYTLSTRTRPAEAFTTVPPKEKAPLSQGFQEVPLRGFEPRFPP
jgi:integrase